MVSRFFQRAYLFLIFLFLYAPIGILIIFSFNNSKSRVNWSGFTLRWYKEMIQDPQILSALYYTLVIAVLAAIFATLIGTFAAMGIHNMRRWQRTIVMNLTNLPVLNPDIVTGISLMILFVFLSSRFRVLNPGFLTMLLAHITFNIPYVILSVLPKFKQLDKNLYEAALDLGATPWYAFFKVILPEISPGIVTGGLLAFTLSLDDFVISFFTTGTGVSNLSILIYSMARRGVNPKLNALSALLFVTTLALLLIVNARSSKDRTRKGKI
ncbi:MAG: ABC transporter permease [Epulopiscium sp.]|nr:ABC transporter permease [Candidatus Epulonipiscium sp.]